MPVAGHANVRGARFFKHNVRFASQLRIARGDESITVWEHWATTPNEDHWMMRAINRANVAYGTRLPFFNETAPKLRMKSHSKWSSDKVGSIHHCKSRPNSRVVVQSN